MNADFPRIITLLRKERGISQKHAASDLQISQALLSHYEKGIRECGLEFLVKVADYYDVSCDYLLGRSPDPNGLTISIDDLPEQDIAISTDDSSLGVIPTLNKKLISNSLNVIYSLLQKCKNRTMMKECSSILMLAVYRVFRIIFSANSKNDDNLFTVPSVMANNCAKSCEAVSEAKAMAAAAGISNDIVDGKVDTDALTITNATLQSEYGDYSASLLSLVQNCESHIQILNNAEK